MKPKLWLSCLLVALFPISVLAQNKQAVVIFKDGFHIRGWARQKKDWIVDPVTGQSFPIPASGESPSVDDYVRRIKFSTAQIQEVLELKPEQIKEQMRLVMKGTLKRGGPIPADWEPESVSDWNNKWERIIKVKTPNGRLDVVQRITMITPYYSLGITIGNDWDFAFLTEEFGPETMRKLIRSYFAEQTTLKDVEQRFQVANFLRQAGWYDWAQKEIEQLVEKYPDSNDGVKEFRAQLRQLQADLLAEDLERFYRVGQHEKAQDCIEQLAKDEDTTKLLSDKNRLTLQELKTKYESLTTQMTQAEQVLKDFPKHASDRKTWTAASKVILAELNLDTIGRLETFLGIAQQHARELKDGQKPTQKTDEVLALAVTGWLQGNNAAETDPKSAIKLFHMREFLLDYLRTEDSAARQQALTGIMKQYDVPADVLIRLIRLLPPANAYTDKLEAGKATKLSIDVPDSEGGSYYLQLPPDYNPHRAYPVVLLLHSHREKADLLVRRWQAEAARHGFILAAPIWGTGLRPTYGYTKGEHAVVLDTLRDLRRKFNVDSDRVFLFGWEQGANAAFDIGLAHPDQFAGVMPMNGDVKGFPQRCWSNAQFLPFYIVEGDRNGLNPTQTRLLFKDWIRGHYPALYIEYKGRSSEWYAAEVTHMMEWMSRKKRANPLKEMGRYHTGGGPGGEEFKTMRATDNRFYWLSTDEILDRHINNYHSWSKTTQPATLQATVGIGNEGSKSGANIWSQFNIRTFGVKQVSLWIAPNQIDFDKKVVIRVNGQQVGPQRTIQPSLPILLEELYSTGDRQRLFLARIDIRL